MRIYFAVSKVLTQFTHEEPLTVKRVQVFCFPRNFLIHRLKPYFAKLKFDIKANRRHNHKSTNAAGEIYFE